MSVDAIAEAVARIEAAAKTGADMDKVVKTREDLSKAEPRLTVHAYKDWLVGMEVEPACIGVDKVGEIYIPDAQEGSHFMIVKILDRGPDSKVPAEATHVIALRGQYPRGYLYIAQSIGHVVMPDSAIAGWFTRVEGE